MRPQGACYPHDRRFWPLLNEAGPKREVGFGNPYEPGTYAPEKEDYFGFSPKEKEDG